MNQNITDHEGPANDSGQIYDITSEKSGKQINQNMNGTENPDISQHQSTIIQNNNQTCEVGNQEQQVHVDVNQNTQELQIGNSKSDSQKLPTIEESQIKDQDLMDKQEPQIDRIEDCSLSTQKPKLQPFQKCQKRKQWDQKYGHIVKTNLEEEKRKIETNMKPPRKPLSPYLFFSQERRKVIKQNKPELNAKQIMKIVSKEWQEITEDHDKEMYEYLSLCDREQYDILCKYWKQIKQTALDNGETFGIQYEPLAGTIAHSVSLRNKICSQTQPNKTNERIVKKKDPLTNIQQVGAYTELQYKNQSKTVTAQTSFGELHKIEKQATNQSIASRKRGRPPKPGTSRDLQGQFSTHQKSQVSRASSNNEKQDKQSESRKNKRNTKIAQKQADIKSSDFICSQKVTGKKDDSDGTDQNEKVRRILEDKRSLHDSNIIAKEQSLQFLGPDPGSQGYNYNLISKRKGRRSQRTSADVTHMGIPIEKGFMVEEDEAKATNIVVTQSAQSEHKKRRKISNVAPSNLAQDNRTSHSDEDVQNPQNKTNLQLVKESDSNILTNQKQDANQKKQVDLNQIKKAQMVGQTTEKKQPNKLQDLFGGYNYDPLIGDFNTEHDVNDPQNTNRTGQEQPTKLIENQYKGTLLMQKRPSSHKNMQTTPVKFEMAQGNKTQVRKSEDLGHNLNQNPEIVNMLNNSLQMPPNNPAQQQQANFQQVAQQAMQGQSMMDPYYKQDLLNQIMSGQINQQLQMVQQSSIGNQHLLLPRSQSGLGSGSNTQTPQFSINQKMPGLQNINIMNIQMPQHIPPNYQYMTQLNQQMSSNPLQRFQNYEGFNDNLDVIQAESPDKILNNISGSGQQSGQGMGANTSFGDVTIPHLQQQDSIQRGLTRVDSMYRGGQGTNNSSMNRLIGSNGGNMQMMGSNPVLPIPQGLMNIGQMMNNGSSQLGNHQQQLNMFMNNVQGLNNQGSNNNQDSQSPHNE